MKKPLRLFYAGEGRDELGDWSREPAYRPRAGQPAQGGILHALVMHYAAATETVDAPGWRHVRKSRVGKHDAPEAQTVLGLALKAEEGKCDVLVFTRAGRRARKSLCKSVAVGILEEAPREGALFEVYGAGSVVAL